MTTGRSRSTASATLITYGTSLAVAVLSLVNVLVVSRSLGATGRGSVAFLTAIAWFTSSLASAGIEEANANLAASEPHHRRAIATNSLVLSFLLGALAVGVVQALIQLAPAVGGPSSSGLRWLTLSFLPVLILSLYLRWLVRADYAFGVTNVALLIPAVVNVAVNATLALVGVLSVGTAVATWLAGQAAATVILIWYVTRRLAGFGRPDLRLMWRALAFGLKTHAGRVMLLGNYRLDQWFVGAISGARELGLYSVAVAWAEALWYLPTALKFVQRPDLVRSAREDAARKAAAAFRASAVATAVLGLAMIAAAPILCVTIFGEQFRGSIVELRLLVAGAVGVVALTVFGNALVAQRRPVLSSIALGAGFLCTLVLDITLIPPYAGTGAALASAIAYWAAGACMSVFFLRALGGRARDLVPRGTELAGLLSSLRSGQPRGRAARPPGTIDGVVTAASARQSRVPSISPLWWTGSACVAALALALASSIGESAAIAVVVTAAAAAALTTRPVTLLWILVASVYIEVVRVEGTTISRVIAPLALLIVVVQLVQGRARILRSGPVLWATGYAVWALASGLWSTSVGGTEYLLGSLAICLAYMLAFGSLLGERRDLKRLLSLLSIASLVVGMTSFGPISSALGLGQVLQSGRSQGGVGDPNFFAAVQLVALPLVIVIAGEARRRWVQIALYATVLVIIGSILNSFSRGGLIGLAVALVLLVVVPFRLLFGSRQRKALALLVVAVGASVMSVRHASDLTRRVETIFGHGALGVKTGSGRIELWKAARTTIGERPWLGLGYGAFPSASNELLLRTPGVDLRAYRLHKNGEFVHNTYLETWAEVGLPGLVLYVGLLISTTRSLRRIAVRARRAGEDFVARVAHALVLGLLTWAVTSTFVSAETARALWIVVGLSLALPKLLPEALLAARAADRPRFERADVRGFAVRA